MSSTQIDVLTPLGKDIWTMEGPKVVFAGAPMHTRMTIVKLTNGDLWIHSPIKLSISVEKAIKELSGTVSVLIAPNKFHHLYIEEWADAYPQSLVFAEQALKRKVATLASSKDITNTAPEIYSDDIEQVNITGNRMFQEAIFFHKASKTLIFTDLFINLRKEGIPFFARSFLRFEQVLYPNGGVPRLYRWFTKDKEVLRQVVQQINAWAPEQITFCHGEPLRGNAIDIINEQFAWLE